jgi:beta-galactosidase
VQLRFKKAAIVSIVAIQFLTEAAQLAGSEAARQQLAADANWRFLLGDPSGAESPSFDDSGWRKVDLPHDWSIEGNFDRNSPMMAGGGYLAGGVGWYRNTFTAPARWKNKKVSVEFDGVAWNATVYLNGQKLGTHPYAYTSFRLDLTPALDFVRRNVLAVRVDDSQEPNSRWYSGAGIYRHVRIVVTDPIHVAPWGVFVSTTEASSAEATMLIKTTVENDSAAAANLTIRTTLFSSTGQEFAHETHVRIGPSSNEETAQKIDLANPEVWSPAHPNLYLAVTELERAGKVIDNVETTFGVRTLTWSADRGLLLNGESIKLAGGAVHHDNGPLGVAAFDRAERRRVELLKAAGFNAIRTAHNPPSPAFLDACDREGVLVIDEAFDVWNLGKAKYDYHLFFKDWWQQDLDSMVLRDRNHPSIVFWSIGNEIPEGWTKDGAPMAEKLAARVRSRDTTRPVTEAVPGATYTPNIDALMAALDVAGYNYNVASNGVRDHERVPTRTMMTTESFPPDAFAQWKVVQEHPYVLGEFVWTAIDYLGESGLGGWSFASPEVAAQAAQAGAMIKTAVTTLGENGENPFAALMKPKSEKPDPLVNIFTAGFPWHGASSGDIDLTGFRKPQSYYRDILWNGGNRVYATVRLPEPTGKRIVAIGWSVYPTLPSWTWPGQEGKDMQVEVYSGTEMVRLFLNDKLVGEMPTGVEQQRRALFTVPYAPGTLKAVGVNENQEMSTSVLQTTGSAVKLHLVPDRTLLQADGEDLSFITVEAEDAEGRMQDHADDDVHFDISGPGLITAVGNGDLTSMERYQGDHRSLFNGRALVVVRTSRTPGTIHLKASASGLSRDEITIQTESGPAKPELQ